MSAHEVRVWDLTGAGFNQERFKASGHLFRLGGDGTEMFRPLGSHTVASGVCWGTPRAADIQMAG